MTQKNYEEMNHKTSAYETGILNELEKTKIPDRNGLEYNVDGCSCMSCGCFKNAWTVVLSPAGVAAGMLAHAADAAL